MRLRRIATLALLAWVCAVPAFAAAPTIGSQDFLRASASAMTLTLANVDAGAGILVVILQNAQNIRTYTVSDSANGSGYTEETDATSASCSGAGTSRCAKFYFLPSSLSTVSMTITITQSSTAQAYAAFGVEINCPNTCTYDTGSSFTNTSATTHLASASSSVINTAVNVFIVSACTGNQSGAEAKKASFTALLAEGVNDVPSIAQYLTTASAVTSERGEMTSGVAGNTECGIVSIKDTVAAVGTTPMLGLLGVGH